VACGTEKKSKKPWWSRWIKDHKEVWCYLFPPFHPSADSHYLSSIFCHLFRCISGYDLVGVVVLGGWLDLVILEVLSNLWFYDLILKLFMLSPHSSHISKHGLGTCLIHSRNHPEKPIPHLTLLLGITLLQPLPISTSQAIQWPHSDSQESSDSVSSQWL